MEVPLTSALDRRLDKTDTARNFPLLSLELLRALCRGSPKFNGPAGLVTAVFSTAFGVGLRSPFYRVLREQLTKGPT